MLGPLDSCSATTVVTSVVLPPSHIHKPAAAPATTEMATTQMSMVRPAPPEGWTLRSIRKLPRVSESSAIYLKSLKSLEWNQRGGRVNEFFGANICHLSCADHDWTNIARPKRHRDHRHVTPVKSAPDTCHCTSANNSGRLLTIDNQMGESTMNLSIGMKR